MPSTERILPPQTAYRRRLSEMLDLTYELEGLLHIGVTRSAVPSRLNQLIVNKLNALVTLADAPATPEEVSGQDVSGRTEEGVSEVGGESNEGPGEGPDKVIGQSFERPEDREHMSAEIEGTGMSENAGPDHPEIKEEEEEIEEPQFEEEEVEEEEYEEEEEDPEDVYPEEGDFEEEDSDDDESMIEEVEKDVQEPVQADSPKNTSVTELDAIIAGGGYYEPGAYVDPEGYVEVDDSFPTMERPGRNRDLRQESPKKETQKKVAAGNPERSRGRLFSINDRFLFAREIFGGNLKNFDRCMDEIITLDSYDEAEEYMIDEWNLDAETPGGIRFLSIISKLFQ